VRPWRELSRGETAEKKRILGERVYVSLACGARTENNRLIRPMRRLTVGRWAIGGSSCIVGYPFCFGFLRNGSAKLERNFLHEMEIIK
jgi:hypothetical protein